MSYLRVPTTLSHALLSDLDNLCGYLVFSSFEKNGSDSLCHATACGMMRFLPISAEKITFSSPVGCPPLHKKLRLPRGVWRSAFRKSVKSCIFCANVLQYLRGSPQKCLWGEPKVLEHQRLCDCHNRAMTDANLIVSLNIYIL